MPPTDSTTTAAASSRIVFQLQEDRKAFIEVLAPVAMAALQAFARHIATEGLVTEATHRSLDLESLSIDHLRKFIACYAPDLALTADQVRKGIYAAPVASTLPVATSSSSHGSPPELTGLQQSCFQDIKNCSSIALRQYACDLGIPGYQSSALLTRHGNSALSKDLIARLIAKHAPAPGPSAGDVVGAHKARTAPSHAGRKHGRDERCIACAMVLSPSTAKMCQACGADQSPPPPAKYSCRDAGCDATWDREDAKFCHTCGRATVYRCCGAVSAGSFCTMCGKKEETSSPDRSQPTSIALDASTRGGARTSGQSPTHHHSTDFFSLSSGKTSARGVDADVLETMLIAYEQQAYTSSDATISEAWLALPPAARRLYVQRAYLPLAAFNRPNPAVQLAKLPRSPDFASAAFTASGVRLNLLPSTTLTSISSWSDFLESLSRLHLLDAHLRTDRVQRNAIDYNIIKGISDYAKYDKALLWYETAARRAVFATSAGTPYPGIGVPPASKIAAWTASAIGAMSKVQASAAAAPRPTPKTPTKKLNSLPTHLWHKAKTNLICFSYNKQGCSAADGHAAVRDGAEVAVAHLCVGCNSPDHGYASCPTKPASP